MADYAQNCIRIHGTLAALQAKYSGAIGTNMSHTNAPAMGINLTVTNFYKNADRTVRCVISRASLRALNAGGSSDTFPYPLEVSACILVGDVANYNNNFVTMFNNVTKYSRTLLFSKPASASTWNDNVYKIASNVTLTGPNPGNNKVYLAISVAAVCSCGTGSADTCVFAVDLTSYMPRIVPYFWRMQHAKDPSATTGTLGWHLVRPFYVCKTINGVKGWCSCEDMTKLVYDANGNKIN